MRLEPGATTWDNAAKVLEARNIFGLRGIAGSCTPDTGAERRRAFLQKGFQIDPLLPYVMLMHLAKNYPELFREDRAYWMDKVAGRSVADALFKGAIEEASKVAAGGEGPSKKMP